ncbi:transposase [Streptomyces sp. NRRL F-2664]|uniref:transposase n=1 Tax=Streptomyces sp. NRRL F-2664 TaxID=1463842 RepID=UPI0009973584
MGATRAVRRAVDRPPPRRRLRQQFEGVLWKFRSRAQWREVPDRFGAWSTVRNRFRQWRDGGVFEGLLEGAVAGRLGGAGWICRGSARAARRSAPIRTLRGCACRGTFGTCGKRLPPGGGGAAEQDGTRRRGPGRAERRRRKLHLAQALPGESRGGLADQIHLAADLGCRPLDVVLTAGRPRTALSSPPFSSRQGSAGPAAVPPPGPAAGARPTHPAATAPTCPNATSKRPFRRREDKAANRKKRAHKAAVPSPATPTSARSGPPSSA